MSLTKWFKEDWRDVKTGKKCGRSGKEKKTRPYPACRPKVVAGKISKQEAKLLSGLLQHRANEERKQQRVAKYIEVERHKWHEI